MWLCLLLGTANARAQVSATSAVYVRSDTDHTTVIAPRVSLSAPVASAARLDLVYTADVWTSASVDIRSSASKAVTEQRDEINAALSHELGDVRLAGSYRYSHEPDYESHGAALGLGLDLAQKSTSLDLRLAASRDQVGRAGDPGFERAARNLSARIGLTQLLDTETFVQLVYEVMSAHGYNSSPYRYVGIGTADGRCRGGAQRSVTQRTSVFAIGADAADARYKRRLRMQCEDGLRAHTHCAIAAHLAEHDHVRDFAWLFERTVRKALAVLVEQRLRICGLARVQRAVSSTQQAELRVELAARSGDLGRSLNGVRRRRHTRASKRWRAKRKRP